MKFGILGCGPAALIAAATAQYHGASVVIASIKKKSFIAGAQYLHGEVPGVTAETPDGFVDYRFSGTRRGYAEKVYGDPDAPVSWDRYYGERRPLPAYNMQRIYDDLWQRYENRIVDVDLSHGLNILQAAPGVDRWVSTIPLRVICDNPEHTFSMQSVHIKQTKMTEGTYFPDEAWVQYNGDSAPSWYRYSRLFGHEAYEWSGQMKKPPIEDVVTIQKPLATNCDCRPDIVRLGRYGSWEKNALVHHVAPAITSLINRAEAVV